MIWLTALASLPFVWLITRHHTLRRLATRNAARRPTEAALVIIGSMLGTAIITGSLVVGDTIDRSIRASAYDQLGPIDETVSVNGLEEGKALVAAFEGFSSPDIDGLLPFTTAGAAAVNHADDGGTQPQAQLIEVDFAAAQSFGPDRAITGITGATPTPGNAAITEDLANRLNVGAGDEIAVHSFGRVTPFVVDRVLPRRGVAGYWTIDGRQQSYNVLVPLGTISSLWASRSNSGEATSVPPEVIMAISNVGGVESGAALTERAASAIDEIVAPLGLRSVPVKETLLDLADTNGKGLSQLYFTIGMFAVAAGVMLLVNIFVMLADERRSEMGMLRAVGMRRTPLVGAFALEGWFYSLFSAALGAVVGIGVGRVIAWRADSILSSGLEVAALKMDFHFTTTTLLNGFALGFLISLITIVVSSVRIVRFNVIRAIRDVQEPPRVRPRRRAVLGGLAVALLGVAYTILGVGASNGFGLMLGPSFVVAGATPLLARRWPGRRVPMAGAVIVLLWAVLAVPVMGWMGISIVIPIFLAQGLTMSAAAIALVTGHQQTIGNGLARASSGSLVVRLGLGYPIARRFRTAMTMGMFSIVILTLVYMSVLSFMFRGQTASLSSDLGGGFEIVATSNASDPVTAAQLEGIPGVDGVAPLSYVFADFTRAEHGEPMMWPVTGISRELVASPPVLADRGNYESSDAAWAAVYSDPLLIIVDDNFLLTAGGPHSSPAKVGDVITISDPQSGQSRQLTVAARAEDDMIGNGPFVSEVTLHNMFGARATPSRYFVSASQPERVAATIRASYVANGADASTFTSIVGSVVAQSSSFFTLMQQFVGAGLVVGVAGIGVIMIRAVRERRREVGVLRSLGFPSAKVGRVMVFEAGFVALEGVLIGVAIALIASYGFAATGTDWAEGLTWGVPVGDVLVIVGVAIVATLATALWPARRAAHIRPAAALRAAD